MTSPLDLHAKLVEIAKKAVQQVKENQRPNDALIPDQVAPSGIPDPPYQR